MRGLISHPIRLLCLACLLLALLPLPALAQDGALRITEA